MESPAQVNFSALFSVFFLFTILIRFHILQALKNRRKVMLVISLASVKVCSVEDKVFHLLLLISNM